MKTILTVALGLAVVVAVLYQLAKSIFEDNNPWGH
jgi:hypothetical protein